MQQVRKQDKTESAAIKYAIENNPEIQTTYSATGATHHTHTVVCFRTGTNSRGRRVRRAGRL
jgi:hypothetical protein